MNEINIKYPTRKFDFSKISLTYPKSVASGSYFTKILYDQLPLYLQIPKCTTKQGLVKMAKKMICELLLDNMNEETVGWFENLDNRCKELVQTHSDDWFGSPISNEDIDTAFGSTIRLYKSGKFSLVKTSTKLHPVTEQPILSVYNEEQVQQSVESITADTNIVAILEITGIRFTSRNFNTEIELKQIMIVEDSWEEDICFNRCVIVPRGRVMGGETVQVDRVIDSEPTTTTTTTTNDPVEKSVLPPPPPPPPASTTDPVAVDLSTKEDSLEIYVPEDLPSAAPGSLIFLADDPLPPTPELTLTDPPVAKQTEDSDLQAVTLDEILPVDTTIAEITLNKPEQIYYELYRKTKQKAKETLLEAKRIKEQYQLDVSDLDSEEDEDEDEEEL